MKWDMTDSKTGLRSLVDKCGFLVLFEELPHIRGSIDGVQEAANEARNRSMETKGIVTAFGEATVKTLEAIDRFKLIEGGK